MCLKGTEVATGDNLKEIMFLETSQNSQENTCVRFYFCEISKNTVLQNTSERLLLTVTQQHVQDQK